MCLPAKTKQQQQKKENKNQILNQLLAQSCIAASAKRYSRQIEAESVPGNIKQYIR